MFYQHLAPNHKLAEHTTARVDRFLEAINLIVTLQNNNSNYKYPLNNFS